jgi:hypothetical protein
VLSHRYLYWRVGEYFNGRVWNCVYLFRNDGSIDMRFVKYFLVAVIAFSSTFCFAGNPANYRYSGNNMGKQVCRAIVNDDVKSLRRALHSYRQTLVFGYSFDNPSGRALAGSFTCNNMELRQFSQAIGAREALGFLNTGTGFVEEQIVSSGK